LLHAIEAKRFVVETSALPPSSRLLFASYFDFERLRSEELLFNGNSADVETSTLGNAFAMARQPQRRHEARARARSTRRIDSPS
jgi:hypothetical protein